MPHHAALAQREGDKDADGVERDQVGDATPEGHNQYASDDRKQDPATGQPRPPRPGYDNADPWYDGRAHDYTIIDSPRGGTWLSADEIEAAFLEYGEAAAEH